MSAGSEASGIRASGVQVAGIQADLAWEDPEANRRALGPRVSAAADSGARLVVLPEMFPTGFSMDAARIAEERGGATEQWMVERAAAHGITLVGSLACRVEGVPLPQNLGLVAHADGRVETYAKIHPFTFASEHEHYSPGQGALTVNVDGVRVSLVICYDLRFGELFATLADRTDLFCVIANWPQARREHWRTLLRARSIETLAYVLGVNRVGEGGKLAYSGDSSLHAPHGELLMEAAPGAEAVVEGAIDPARVAEARAKFPVLGDRRPELYKRL